MVSSFRAAFRCCSARRISRANRGGTGSPPCPRQSTALGTSDFAGGVVKKKTRVLSSFFPMRRSCLRVGIALPVSSASIRASEVPAARASSSLPMNTLFHAHRRVGPLIGTWVMVSLLSTTQKHCCGSALRPSPDHRTSFSLIAAADAFK